MSRPNGKRSSEDADAGGERRHAAGDARDSRRKSWLENVPAYRVLTEAIRAVPPVRYALGVAGVVAVLGIVAALGVDLRVAAFGTPILLVLMVVLVVFRHVASAARARLALPALVFVWSSLIVTITVVVLLLSSVFFRVPMDLQQFIIGGPSPARGSRTSRENITQLVKAATAQAEAGDYASGWKLVSQAVEQAPQSSEARDAQTGLAMLWLRNMRYSEAHHFGEYVDPLLPCLNEAAVRAKGREAADALAHIGWAYSLKYRDRQENLAVTEQFRRAVALDPANVYAHAMCGFWILWEHGPVDDAEGHFSAALKSGREHQYARYLQVCALDIGCNHGNTSCAVHLIRVWNEMRQHKEALPVESRKSAIDHVYWASMGDEMLAQLDSILPAPDHLATFLWLTEGIEGLDEPVTMFWRARLTEAVGDYPKAMGLYLVATSQRAEFKEQTQQGIKRCAEHGARVAPALAQELGSSDPRARAAAAVAAGEMGAAALPVLHVLLDALKDPQAAVRSSAVSSLPNIGGDAAAITPELIKVLNDADQDVRNGAEEAFRQLGVAAVPALVVLLADEAPRNRQNAAHTLSRIGPPASSAQAALVNALKDKSPEVRAAAGGAIGEIHGEARRAVPALVRTLKEDHSREVREAAAVSLGQFGPDAKEAVPALAEALTEALNDTQDTEGFRGERIEQALGEIGPAAGAAVPVLIEALGSDHIRVPVWAADALGKIGAPSKPAISRLAQVLKDEEVEHLKNEAEPLVQIAEALENAGDSQALQSLKDGLKTMEAREVAPELVQRMQDAVSSLAARQRSRTVGTN
jgi:HEAT repeat protein/Tfp pilus assembly protein PilF